MRRSYHGSFTHLSFPKKGSAIRARVHKMIAELTAKIKEREGRIEKLAKEMKLGTSLDVLRNLDKLTANHGMSNSPDMPVGKMAALRQESDAMKANQEEVERLQTIYANLPANETFKLDFEELRYFGF